MLFLVAADQSVTVTVAGSSPVVDIGAVWGDRVGGSTVFQMNNAWRRQSSAATVAVVTAPAANTQRAVNFLSFYNGGANSVTLTISLVAGETVIVLQAATLLTGATLTYSAEAGWAYPSQVGITQLTGDVTAGPGSGSQVATLATTAVAAGSYGSATAIPTFTVDTKGRLTAAATSGTAVVPVTRTVNGQALSGNLTLPDDNAYKQAGTSPIEIWYVANQGNCTAMTTASPSGGPMRAFPFIAPSRGGTIDRIGVNITAGAVGNFRVGIYANTSTTVMYPGALIAQSGDLDTNVTGLNVGTFNVQLTPNQMYWLVYHCSAAATIRAMAVGGVSNLLGNSNALGTAPNVGISASQVYGPLPDPYPSGAAMLTAVPIPAIAYRFSA